MKNTHVKIFSDTAIITNRLSSLLEEKGIASFIKNNVESGRLAGFGTMASSVELFVLEEDLEKAQPIAESYLKEINS